MTKPLLLDKVVSPGALMIRAPSNIALVKYWGKRDQQLPCNPSLSLTLSKAYTESELRYEFESLTPKNQVNLFFNFAGGNSLKFSERLRRFLNSLLPVYPFLGQLKISLRSKNSFPHSTGIASSASAMASLGLGLAHLERQFFGTLKTEEEFLRKASFLARLGSGSAARSIYGGAVTWGRYEDDLSSDEYASPVLGLHPVFETYCDSIVIVDSTPKAVSSSKGHEIMKASPYAQIRFKNAQNKLQELMGIMKRGELEAFATLVENEALELHGMMLASNYILLKPRTLALIEKLRTFREETKTPLCFTLDAGPNLHLLYPLASKPQVQTFLASLDKGEYEKVIDDQVGRGAGIFEVS